MKNEIQEISRLILASRKRAYDEAMRAAEANGVELKKEAEEGGCGVTGFCSTIPVAGRHIHKPSLQMHNRGNGKGGGIAAVGLVPEQFGVSRDVLETHYCLQIATITDDCIGRIEKKHILPNFDIAASSKLETIDDWRDMKSLPVRPPDVYRYFVRVKPAVLDKFIKAEGLQKLGRARAEDEFINRNSIAINRDYYASLGEKQAFVMSQGRNMLILKIVGFAEDIVQYYKIEDMKAHSWIAHQRYPTKGRVWHPGGAHPFSGLDEALVHNGDFANYYSVSEYLKQRGIVPMFLTDTEVSILVFDLLHRVYRYPLEYIIEALAPTTEMDFDLLPAAKQQIYRQLQIEHSHSSPDGPWFFIITRNMPYENKFQLIGITDTAMLRPQVFALHDGDVQVGLICSEKQAIDATLRSLAAEDSRFCPIADKYWNARGGSCSDGGSFIFTISNDPKSPTGKKLDCTDKFGNPVSVPKGQKHCDITLPVGASGKSDIAKDKIVKTLTAGKPAQLASDVLGKIKSWDFGAVRRFCDTIVEAAKKNDKLAAPAIEALTLILDKRCHTGDKKRASVLQLIDNALTDIFKSRPPIESTARSTHKLIGWRNRKKLRSPRAGETTLVINAEKFEPEGNDRDSALIVEAHKLGWKRFITFNLSGQRFHGCGLGPATDDVRIDVYGSSGDYLASGIDGLTIIVHGNAQDQLCQIMKRGSLIVHGDVGQTFMYGAKGGEAFILGNAAGRPLINAAGRPRVIINGTCLDYLAESFMAGDPLNGGGFVILNGLKFDDFGNYERLDRPYPGSNLFSLASGGAIYILDPNKKTVEEQLNGGSFVPMTDADWALIKPYLERNEKMFGIKVDDLLTVKGKKLDPKKVFRKVGAVKIAVLASKSTDDSAAAGHTCEEEEY